MPRSAGGLLADDSSGGCQWAADAGARMPLQQSNTLSAVASHLPKVAVLVPEGPGGRSSIVLRPLSR